MGGSHGTRGDEQDGRINGARVCVYVYVRTYARVNQRRRRSRRNGIVV